MRDLADLRRRATELGVETGYWDVDGQHHDTPERTLRHVVDVLEDDLDRTAAPVPPVIVIGGPASAGCELPVGGATFADLTLADGTTVRLPAHGGRVDVVSDLPFGCHDLRIGDATATLVVAPPTMPHDIDLDGRAGLFVPAYALWTHADPLPSFAHLADLAARLPELGLDVLSTLPLYAAFLDDPFDPSPYSPMSRLHWNEVYLDDASLPTADRPPLDRLVDWPTLGRRRRRQLLAAAADVDRATGAALDEHVRTHPDVADYARFRTARPDTVDAAHPAELVQRSHVLAQYLATRQLAAIEGPGRADLALDLPIGGHPAGYETWAHPELFASGMTVGAPPDALFDGGQDWGFPPPLPGAGRRSGHVLWRRLVARAGEHASVLRIDHVMGVQRLWWVPAGAGPQDGTYVRYPRDELLAVIAAEAAATNTTIVGEDLGTVPPEILEALADWDALGLYEEQFHLDQDHLEPIPARAFAGARTHDMPAFAAAMAALEPASVERYRRLLGAALGREVPSGIPALFDALLERLSASAACVVLADLDDLLGGLEPHNVPGRILPTTWRRRLAAPISDMLCADVRRRAQLLGRRTPRP